MTAYRADIDGLRAVAVSAVILFHAKAPFFGGGFVGVDIFFVISGYLITHLILSDLDRGTFSLAGFYVRRIRRIFPALFVVILATAVAGWAVLTPLDLKLLGESVAATAAFASNVLFWRSSGYFEPPLSQWPLLHTWSLSLEEQYYVVFPALLILLTFAMPRRRIGVIAALACGSFLLSAFATAHYPRAAFLLAPFRVWEFLAGALLAMGIVPHSKRPLLRDGAALLGAGAIALVIVTFTADMTFPGVLALLPVLGAAAIIWSGEDAGARSSTLLSLPPLVLAGKMSYSLYLWHFPILAFAAYLSLDGLGPGQTAALLALTAALSFLSWKFVEQPVREKRWMFGRRPAVFAFAALVTLASGAFGVSAYIKGGFPNRFGPATLNILAAELEIDTSGSDCALTLEKAKAGNFCRIGAASAGPAFLLWGDSHASALLPGVELAAARSKAAGVMASYGGCIPAIGIERSDLGVCDAVNEAVLAHVLASPEIKTVILAGRWALWTEGTRYKAEDRLPKQIVVTAPGGRATGNRALVEGGLDALVGKLKSAGKDVWLAGPVPEIGYPVPRALYLTRLHPLLARDIRPSAQEFQDREGFVLDMLGRLESKHGVHVIWPHLQLCKDTECAVQSEGQPLYADDSHLTVLGARSIAPSLDRIFGAPPARGN